MRALLSKQEEPSLYRSTGNYFSHVLRSNRPAPEKRPKVHFALFLKTSETISDSAECHAGLSVRFESSAA